MADSSDVEAALVALIGAALYPPGTTPVVGASACGVDARVYRGYPNEKNLDTDLAAGISDVSVYEMPGFWRLQNNRLDPDSVTFQAQTLTVSVSGDLVTFGGTAALGELAGIMAGQVPTSYAVQANDTPATIATALAAQLTSLGVSAFSTGATVQVSGAGPLVARLGVTATVLHRVRQQTAGFRVVIWSPTSAARDTLASFVDGVLAAHKFITLPDGQSARLKAAGNHSNDVGQKEDLWRRDLIFTCQYMTTSTTTVPTVMWITETISVNGGAVVSTHTT